MNFMDRDRLFPHDTVVGVIDDTASLDNALEVLFSGFGQEDVHVLCGPTGLRRIDPHSEHKDELGRIFRLVDDLDRQPEPMRRHVQELRDGHFLVVVGVSTAEEVRRAKDALLEHDGHFLNHYTRWTTTQLAA